MSFSPPLWMRLGVQQLDCVVNKLILNIYITIQTQKLWNSP